MTPALDKRIADLQGWVDSTRKAMEQMNVLRQERLEQGGRLADTSLVRPSAELKMLLAQSSIDLAALKLMRAALVHKAFMAELCPNGETSTGQLDEPTALKCVSLHKALIEAANEAERVLKEL